MDLIWTSYGPKMYAVQTFMDLIRTLYGPFMNVVRTLWAFLELHERRMGHRDLYGRYMSLF